jgi:hypothetical protein
VAPAGFPRYFLHRHVPATSHPGRLIHQFQQRRY